MSNYSEITEQLNTNNKSDEHNMIKKLRNNYYPQLRNILLFSHPVIFPTEKHLPHKKHTLEIITLDTIKLGEQKKRQKK